MSTKELKKAIADRIKNVSDDAPADMLQRLLDAIDELTKADGGELARMQRFLKNIEEDKNLLQRLAQ